MRNPFVLLFLAALGPLGCSGAPDSGKPPASADSGLPGAHDSGPSNGDASSRGDTGAGNGGDSGATNPGDGSSANDSGMGDASACAANLQTDSMNCGACGHDCLGAACAAGMCAPAGVGNNGNLTNLGAGFALDTNNVYVSGQEVSGNKVTNVIAALPLSGGAPSILAQTTTGAWTGNSILLADGHIYWSDENRAAVYTVALTASAAAAKNLYDDGAGSSPLAGLGATSSTLYWLEACSGLYSAALPTGASKTVANYSCNSVDMNQAALDPAGKYFYYSDEVDGEIVQVKVADGTQAIVVSNVGQAYAVAVDATYVYWTDGGTCSGSDANATCTGGKVMRALPSGGSATTLAENIDSTGAWGGLSNVAVDSDAVYYTVYNNATSTLYERKLAGGTPFALATIANFIVPSGSYVYYSVGGGGIARVAK
jgi:hypothetical protein